VVDNLDLSIRNGKVLSDRADGTAGETVTKQENIQDWFQLEEGDPAFQILIEEQFATLIVFIYFHQNYIYNYIFLSLFITFLVFLGDMVN
jgi:hypothetical protein